MAEMSHGDAEDAREQADVDRGGGDDAANGPQPRRIPAQFSMQGMLWFMAACAAYFAQLQDLESLKNGGWSTFATVVVAWLIVAKLYLRIRYFPALILHCFALGASAIIPAFYNSVSFDLWEIVLFGCFLGTFFSLPAFVVMMAAWALDRKRRELK